MPTVMPRNTDDLSCCQWTFEDFVSFHLSKKAAERRNRRRRETFLKMDQSILNSHLEALRCRIKSIYDGKHPRVSIILRAYNEERELLPTLISYACMDIEPGTAELIVVDNGSTDGTRQLIEAAGAKYVFCQRKGIGYATQAGYAAMSPSSEYVLISDGDVRVVPPQTERACPRTKVLKISLDYLEQNSNVMGVSTGVTAETTHWVYRFVDIARWLKGRRKKISYWCGGNQLFRRKVLDAVGGIDPKVEYGCGEGFNRLYTVARYCRERQLELHSGDLNDELISPFYASNRRISSIPLIMRHVVYAIFSPKRNVGSDNFPVFERDVQSKKIEVRR